MSTGVGMSECCLSGKVHEGKPAGHETVIGGLDTYVSEPDGARTKYATVIFLVDIFGWTFPNTRLLADNYAKAGFKTYVPDVHNSDSLPAEFLQVAEPPLKVRGQLSMVDKGVKLAKVGTTLGPWLLRHREAVSKPIIDGFINAVKLIPGTDKVGTLGFCWGGRYAILSAHGQVDAAFACHPSLVTVPGDFDGVTKPLGLACGDQDSLLAVSKVKKIKDLLAKKSDVPTEVEIYADQVHGFALRGDFSSEKDKAAMDKAEKQGQAWFHKYLAEG